MVHTFTLLPHGDCIHVIIWRQYRVRGQWVLGSHLEYESCLEDGAQYVLFIMFEPLGLAELVYSDWRPEAGFLGREQSLCLTPESRQEPLHRRRGRREALLRRLDLLETPAGHEPRFHWTPLQAQMHETIPLPLIITLRRRRVFLVLRRGNVLSLEKSRFISNTFTIYLARGITVVVGPSYTVAQ